MYAPPPVPNPLFRPVDVASMGPEAAVATIAEPAARLTDTAAHRAGIGETYVAGHANLLRNKGFDAGWVARPGRHPAAVIADHLNQHDYDVVVLTTHGRAGLDRVVIGSTTMSVAHHAPCPVLAQAPAAGDHTGAPER